MLGAKHNPLSLIFTLGGFLALILLAQAVATRPELIDGIGVRLVKWFNSVRGKPSDTGLDKWRQDAGQLESVSLNRAQLGMAFIGPCSIGRRTSACLLVRGLRGRRAAVAGGADRRVRRRPCGRGDPVDARRALVVEAVLVPGLVSSGMTLASAISAMLIYRLISWIFIAAIGWVVFFFMFRTEKDIDPDAVLEDEELEAEGPPQFSPDPEARHEPEP